MANFLHSFIHSNYPILNIKLLCKLFLLFLSFFLATIASAENPIQNFTPQSPPLAKGDKGGFAEKKTLKAGEFSFYIKDGNLWIEARDADLQEILKAVGKKAKIEVEVDKEIKEKITIKFEAVSLEEGIQKIAKNWVRGNGV